MPAFRVDGSPLLLVAIEGTPRRFWDILYAGGVAKMTWNVSTINTDRKEPTGEISKSVRGEENGHVYRRTLLNSTHLTRDWSYQSLMQSEKSYGASARA